MNIANIKFGNTTALSPHEKRRGRWYWLCVCDCGKQHIAEEHHLRSLHTKSCGCLKKIATDNLVKLNTKHSMAKTRLYRVWNQMRQRCNNPKNEKYPIYGGRGIKVCERWNDFCLFAEDVGAQPKGMTLDRIDSEKDYSPENIRWATYKQQARNKRNNTLLTFNGETRCLSEWAESIGISSHCLIFRLYRRLWPIEKALTTKSLKK